MRASDPIWLFDARPGRRYSLLAAVVALAALAALVFPLASPSQTTTTWSGTWNTSYGTMILTQTGSSVEGTYAFEDGHVSGTVSGNVFSGRWDEAPRATAHDRGPFVFTMRADGKSFTGTWGHDDTGPYPDPWNGTCTGGPCLQNGTAPPPAPPLPQTPRSVRPDLGELTSYKAPPPGKTAKLPTPVLGPKTNVAEVDIATTSATGGARPAPPVAGVVLTRAEQEARNEPPDPDDIRAEKAFQLCYILAVGEDISRGGIRAFVRCAITVQEILRRADEIEAKRRGGGRAAQAARCPSVNARQRGKRRLRAAVRVRCIATATGVRLTIRRRKGAPALRSLFGRKSGLIVGRSRFDAPAQPSDLTNVVWRARSR